MNKTKKKLRKDWEQACNGFLTELLRMWELDAYYGNWIAEEVGGVYDYGDGMFTISMDDIIYCVENDVKRDQYTEWLEYCCEALEFGFDTPNLRSWMRGCPRTPAETFERLRKMKADLNKEVESEKDRVKGRTAGNAAGTVTKNDNER